METSLLELGAVLAVLAVVVLILRAASNRSAAKKPTQERLAAEEDTRPRRERERRPRPADRAKKPADKKPGKKTDKKTDKKPGAKQPAEPEPAAADADDEAEPGEDRAAYRAGLARTRGGFVAKLGRLFGKKQIDEDLLGELEEVLFTADIGPRAADRIFQSVKGGLSKDELTDAGKVWGKIRETSSTILSVDAAPVDFADKQPFVLLVLGVNGVGKTTTIGKLAAKLAREGKKVVLAAGDTFRAAATEQLEEWGKRAEVPVVKGKPGGDPSSVIFDAVRRGIDDGADVVICDTAGRLHSNQGLMDELRKVRRVCDKALPGAPHETWMVLDATTGQNAISQAKTFKEAMEITGIVLTKLDGSAKGGVILGICDELKVPVRFIGVGEKIDDLRPFDPSAFVDALYGDAGDATAA
jgi:fused signal recognition particle receptor